MLSLRASRQKEEFAGTVKTSEVVTKKDNPKIKQK